MADTSPARDNGELAARLAALVAGRSTVLDRIIVAARRAQVGALLLIGSLGRGGGDAWSDLDLIAVPGPHCGGLDLVKVFAGQVLAVLDAPRNPPIGGHHVGLCLDVASMALWIDCYVWPQVTAMVPADATAIYDDLGLARSDQDFIPLINASSDPSAPAHPANSATTLLQIAVAAKYLARADVLRLNAKMADAQGLSLGEVAERLQGMLAGIHEPDLARAVAATRRLVDLAIAASGHSRFDIAHHGGAQGVPMADAAIGLAYGTVAIANHQAQWAVLAATQIRVLRQQLAGYAGGVEHVGSTAVPGLAAKPILDLALRLGPQADPDTVAELLTSLGWIFRGNKHHAGGRLFVAERTPGLRTMHLHVLAADDPQWAQYLLVRDMLRANPAAAAQYQRLKHDLAARHAEDRAAYTAAKAQFLTELLADSPADQSQ